MSRQRQRQYRAAAGSVCGGERAAVALDDAVTNREAKAHALADRLGREKRVEQLWQVVGVDSRAIVGEVEDCALALAAPANLEASGFIRRDRVGGVLHEIHDD